MSNGINRVVLFGNLGADPEVRATQSGQLVLKLRVATNEAYYDKEKNLVERTEWHSVTVFGARAEALGKLLAKGDSLLVEGSIRYSSYEKEGVTRYRSEIVARDICLGGRRKPPVAVEPAAALEMVEDPFAETNPGFNASSSDDSKQSRRGDNGFARSNGEATA